MYCPAFVRKPNSTGFIDGGKGDKCLVEDMGDFVRKRNFTGIISEGKVREKNEGNGEVNKKSTAMARGRFLFWRKTFGRFCEETKFPAECG